MVLARSKCVSSGSATGVNGPEDGSTLNRSIEQRPIALLRAFPQEAVYISTYLFASSS